MTHLSYDVLLVGGGLANGMIALRLARLRPELRIALIERGGSLGGNHTWSFHGPDLTSDQHEWIEPLIVYRWSAYETRFPDGIRQLPSTYMSVTSTRFHAVLNGLPNLAVHLSCEVAQVSSDRVVLADGRLLSAPLVIDGRGAVEDASLILGYQTFLGEEWELDEPHDCLHPVVMDATVPQHGGYRFVYTLPLSKTRVLVEDTHYVDDGHVPADVLKNNVRSYMAARGWAGGKLLRTEQGSLPIVLAGDLDRHLRAFGDVPRVGLRAAQFHQTTGYSLPHAVALAERVADAADLSSREVAKLIKALVVKDWGEQRFFRLLNRMFFLAGSPNQRWRVMQRFYQLDSHLIQRFYAGRLTILDKVRILTGKPPVPVFEAMRAANRTRTSQFQKR